MYEVNLQTEASQHHLVNTALIILGEGGWMLDTGDLSSHTLHQVSDTT